jgi:hypothetical protein
MEDLFARFIDEEFKWIYSDSEAAQWFIEGFDNKFTEDEFYEHFEEFKNQVVNETANDDWLIQQIHERMDDMLIDALKDYLNNK